MVVASMHLGVWSWSRQSPELQTECQNFERGMVVGARWASLSISQSAQLLGFSHTTISIGFTKNGVKREKKLCGSTVGENTSLMLEVRGEWAD